MRQVSSGHAIAALLAGVTVLLAVIAAIAVARIDDHRARYERDISRAYRVEAAGWRLAAGGQPDAGEARYADRVARFVRDDPPSVTLLAALRRAAGERPAAAREAAAALGVRQARQRASARRQLDDRDEAAVVAAVAAGGGALVLAVALVGAIAARMRRPVEQLAAAAREVLGGRPPGRGGPAELRTLADALAALAADERPGRAALPPPGNGEVLAAMEEFGQPLVLCDATGRVTHLNERARHLLPDARVGAPIGHAEFDADGRPLAGRTRVTLAGRTLGLAVARADHGTDSLWVVRDLGPAAA